MLRSRQGERGAFAEIHAVLRIFFFVGFHVDTPSAVAKESKRKRFLKKRGISPTFAQSASEPASRVVLNKNAPAIRKNRWNPYPAGLCAKNID
jgi:hypothetical protein